MEHSKSGRTLRDACQMGICVAAMAVMAQISVPLPGSGVRITLQVFAVALAGMTLGAKRGAVAAVVYVLLGAVGIPVFAQFTATTALFGATGGYILTFPALAFFAGWGAYKRRVGWRIAGSAIGMAVLYIGGTAMFCALRHVGVREALVLCVVPFVVPDILKIAVADVVAARLRKLRGLRD